MGGRRATSLADVLGPGRTYPGLQRKLHNALTDKNPQAISDAAAELAIKAVPRQRLDSYLKLLVPFIKKRLAKPAAPEDIRREVRIEWTHIKKAHGIEVRRVVNDAVVQAAEDLLRSRR